MARKDFFNVRLHDAPFAVPFAGGDAQLMMAAIGKVDAVIGNPPYVRQEKINEYYGTKYKIGLQKNIAALEAPGAALSGRSDLHVYFFPHGASFLEDGGYMGLLTSSSWLDTAYGFRLQKYLLDNFEIIAIFESASEPWFTGARVTTAATILRRQTDPIKRAANMVHFVKIQRELSDILALSPDEESRQIFFENMRDHIESLSTDETNENWRIRCISQAELYLLGQSDIKIEEDESDEDENGDSAPSQSTIREPSAAYSINDNYFGYKWGIFLRAPDVFFKLRKRAENRLVPLIDIAHIKRGVTSGVDDFFFPTDITEEELARIANARQFKDYYGLRPSDTEKIRVVRAGDGSVHLIESQFLEPEIHSLMEINSISIKPTFRRIVLCSDSKDALKKHKRTNMLDYIRWGEREKYNERPTCASRERWYDVTDERQPGLIFPKLQQYRHIICLNPQGYYCSSALMDIVGKNLSVHLLGAVLNSTIVALTKHLFGRIHGREGSLQLDVYATNMMLVPDPRDLSALLETRILHAFSAMSERDALPLVSVDGISDEWSGELALPDRQELDDAMLELLGISDAQERQALRAELYSEMTKLYREIRATEKKMQKFRAETARHGRPTPQSLAEEIWETFAYKPQAKPLSALVPTTAITDTISFPAGKPKAVLADMFNPNSLQFGRQFVPLGSPERVIYALHLIESGAMGQMSIPVDPTACAAAVYKYEQQQATLALQFEEAAANYTADEQLQSRIVRELWRKASIESN